MKNSIYIGGGAVGASLLAAYAYRKYRNYVSEQRRKNTEQEIKTNFKNYIQNKLESTNASSSP